MNETKLNFINRSKDNKLKDIVFYQPNEASMSYDEIPIAWKVIKNCGINDNHSFFYNPILEVAIGDSYGNYKTPIEVETGRILEIVYGNFGGELQLTNKLTYNPNEFAVLNGLRDGSFTANCFRNERLLATINHLYSGESALFRFSDTICISALSEADEGEEIDIELLGEIETRFDLSGVGSADIIMTGGGSDGFQFSMENIQRKIFKREDNFDFPQW